jgi:hypothetical protein
LHKNEYIPGVLAFKINFSSKIDPPHCTHGIWGLKLSPLLLDSALFSCGGIHSYGLYLLIRGERQGKLQHSGDGSDDPVQAAFEGVLGQGDDTV